MCFTTIGNARSQRYIITRNTQLGKQCCNCSANASLRNDEPRYQLKCNAKELIWPCATSFLPGVMVFHRNPRSTTPTATISIASGSNVRSIFILLGVLDLVSLLYTFRALLCLWLHEPSCSSDCTRSLPSACYEASKICCHRLNTFTLCSSTGSYHALPSRHLTTFWIHSSKQVYPSLIAICIPPFGAVAFGLIDPCTLVHTTISRPHRFAA